MGKFDTPIRIAGGQIKRLKQQISLYRKLLGGGCRILSKQISSKQKAFADIKGCSL